MANVPLSKGVPKIYVPSLSAPQIKVPQIKAPQIEVPGAGTVRYKNKPKRLAKDLGDILLGDPLLGTKQLQNTLDKEGFVVINSVPILNRIVGAGAMMKQRALEPMLQGKPQEVFINTLETVGSSLDILSNPVKSLLPVAGGGTPNDFLKSMGWVDDEYREMYQWNSGNFVVDLIGEIVSDPLNWVSFGTKQVIKEGTEQVEEVVYNALKRVLKTDDIPKELVEKYTIILSDALTDEATVEEITKMLTRRSDELRDLIKAMPKSNQIELAQTRQLLSQYQNLLNEDTRKLVNQHISDMRMSDWYKKYATIKKVADTSKTIERDITIAASILAPAYGLAQLTFKHLISPTFKTLWNKYVVRAPKLDINKVINDMPGTIKEETNKIITRSRTINKELFESFDEMLSKYSIDSDVLIKDYINLISNTPSAKLNKNYLDDEFRKLMFKRIPELKLYYGNKETKEEVIQFLERFKPKEYKNIPLDEYIEKIRETAIVAQGRAKQIKDMQKYYIKDVSNIIDTMNDLDIQDRLLVLEKGFVVDGVKYSYKNFKQYLNALYKADKEKYREITYVLSYLGVNKDNASQIATLLKKNTPDALEKLKTMLSTTAEAKLVPIKDVDQYVKALQDPILNFKAPTTIPSTIDEIKTNKLLNTLDGMSKKQVTEIVKGTNAIVDNASLNTFKEKLYEISDLINLNELDAMPKFTDMDVDLDILNSTFVKDLLENDFDLKNIKDVNKLHASITDLKRKATYWFHQLDDARFSEELSDNLKRFIIELNGLMSDIGTKQLVTATDQLARLGDDYIKLLMSKQGSHTAMIQNLLAFFEVDDNKKVYMGLSDLTSPLRNNVNVAMNALLEEGGEEALQVANAMQQTLIYIDGFNSTLPLTDRLYTSYDIPKECKDSIYGEIFNYLYANKDKYVYRLPDVDDIADTIVRNYERNNSKRLIEYFEEHPTLLKQDISYLDEMTELEKKLQQGTLDSAGELRYEELKEVIADNTIQPEYIPATAMLVGHLDEVYENVRDAMNEYLQRLNLYSAYNNYEFKFYTTFTSDAVGYMNELGRSFSSVMEYLDKAQVDVKVMTDVQSFISTVSGERFATDVEELIRTMKGRLVKEVTQDYLHYNPDSLSFAITDTFTQIDRINKKLADDVGKLGYDMYGDKVKNILNYYSIDDFNNVIRTAENADNSYIWSTQNGMLAVRYELKQDVIDKLGIQPSVIKAQNGDYTKLYTNLSQAYNRAERLGAYKIERVADMRNWLTKLFEDNNINWGPNNPHIYFTNATDTQVRAWDGMLRSTCFSKSAARKYRMIRQLDYATNYGAKADYYSNPWKIYTGIDEINEEVFSNDDAYDKVIELIDTDKVISNEYFDELYRGVTADLQQVVHDPKSLLDYRFLFQTQIQEQVKSIDNLRKLDSLRLNYKKVGDVVKDKKTLKMLKTYGIHEDTLLGNSSVQRFMYHERKQLLSDNLKTFTPKQLRTWIDKNTAGIMFWVVDESNPLPVLTPNELKEAGLICKKLPRSENIFIIRRTDNLMTDTPYTYKIRQSYFAQEQKAITDIFKANRHDFYWDGMDVPDEMFTGNMMPKGTYDTILKDPYVMDIIGDETEQKVYSKIDEKGLNSFFTSDISRPEFVFLGAPDALSQIIEACEPTFILEGIEPKYYTTNLIKATWQGNIAAVKRENKVNKYLQLWLNDTYSLGNQTFRPILENATDEELKDLFSNKKYAAVIVRQDSKNRPKVYKIFIENQKQLQDAIKAQAIMVPQEIYRNMILAVNKHQVTNQFERAYKNIVAATYKSIWLRTPGFLFRNFLDSAVYKNASTSGGMEAIIDNFKYEMKARRLLEWHNQVQEAMLHLHAGTDILADGTYKPEILDKAIASFNRKQIRYGLKHLTKEDARATYCLVDMFLSSSASGGLSKALEQYLLDYSMTNGKFNGTAFEKWYGEKVLGGILFKPFQTINDTIEQSSRLGLFLKLVDEGGDYTEAIRKVVATHFDYSLRESGIEMLDDVFWFSTFPINNFLYYLNGGILENPNMLKLQMDAMELSWNNDEITWEDVKQSKYLQNYALAGHIRFKWIDNHQVVLKTGSSVYDFLSLLINPIAATKDHLNPFLSVLFGVEKPDSLNPFIGDINRLKQIQQRLNSPLGSFVPSVYTKFDLYKPREYHRIEWAPYVRRGKGSVKPKKSYFKKPDNMKRMRYQFTTYRYYFNRGKNLHRWLTSTNSIEPYWYMNKRRWMRTGRKPRFMKQVVHIK